jgi:hypothetical protein
MKRFISVILGTILLVSSAYAGWVKGYTRKDGTYAIFGRVNVDAASAVHIAETDQTKVRERGSPNKKDIVCHW